MANVEAMSPEQKAIKAQQEAQAFNMQARLAVLNNAFPVSQQVDSQTFVPNSKNTFDVQGTNVGILKGFVLRVNARIKNNGANPMSLTNFGLSNILQKVTYYDPNNQRHIETTGWHIGLINTIKGQNPFGSVSELADYPINVGNHYDICTAPKTINAGATADVVMHYWIPLAYSETDLTGAVFLNVAQSKQRLRLEFANDNTAFSGLNESSLESVYRGDAVNATIETMTYTCYQHYLDQLPMFNGQFILPALDLSTLYLLENTTVSGLTPNSDFPVQYGNLYRYLSTVGIYENGTDFFSGEDINYLALKTANFSDYRKASPETWNLETRKLLKVDLPPAVYLAETRARPIYTLQTGNQTFVVNPKIANANARLHMGYESFVSQTNLVNLGSISTT